MQEKYKTNEQDIQTILDIVFDGVCNSCLLGFSAS